MSYYNNIIISMLTLYFICLLFFLIPISILITYEINMLINLYYLSIKIKSEKNDIIVINLVKLYIRRRRWLFSIRLLEDSLSHNGNTNYYNYLGICYSTLQQYTIARYHYEQVLKIDPDNLMSLSGIAKLYILTNQSDKAFEAYMKILNIDPKDKSAKYNINQLMRSHNRDSRI
uniref:Uncharacterized protein n=1 Tax=Riquetophycus sp. TaxID=1897556 RepID=A0A1C9C8B1_9FLOR|nr:hypothetical protein Riqu_133 [Riquetophycus sp.]